MTHDHPNPEALHWNCDACIDRVQRDQFAAELPHLDTDDLMDICGRSVYVPDWKWALTDAELVRREAEARTWD